MVTGPGVRVDTGVAEGDSIPPEFDSMVAKVIAYGQNSNEALSRLQRSFAESVIVVNGGASNKAFLLKCWPARKYSAEISLSDGWIASRHRASTSAKKYADVALVQAAIDAYDAECAVEQAQFYASAARGRPLVRSEIGRTLALRYRTPSLLDEDSPPRPARLPIEVDGLRIEAHIDRLDKFESWLTVFGRRFHIVSVSHGIQLAH